MLGFPKLLLSNDWFELWSLETFWEMNLDQTFWIHKNNLDCKWLTTNKDDNTHEHIQWGYHLSSFLFKTDKLEVQ